MTATAAPAKPAGAELTRLEKIERYIVRDALETFLGSCIAEGGWNQEKLVVLPEAGESIQDILVELGRDLFSELWPEDEDVDSAEFRLASMRTHALVAQMFAQLAGAETGWAGRAAEVHADHVTRGLQAEVRSLVGDDV